MSRSRKTFEVRSIFDTVNTFIKRSTDSPDRRQGHIDLLTEILFATGNYAGFRYLAIEEVPDGELPGINVDLTVANTPIEGISDNVDRTRIEFLSEKLR